MYVPSATFVTSKVNEPLEPEQVVGFVPDALLNTGKAFTVTFATVDVVVQVVVPSLATTL